MTTIKWDLMCMARRSCKQCTARCASAGVLLMAGLNVQVWFGEPVLHTLVRWGMAHL